ncbi:MAG: hypothetical protein K6F05_07760 [Succinivibrio sp.]|nr:hypothetical protein [Succinivibrio sp.]
MHALKLCTLILVGVYSLGALALEEEEVTVPEDLTNLAAKLTYPPSVCSISKLARAPFKCLPGEIFWYTPDESDHAQGLTPLSAAATYCNLHQPIEHDEKNLICVYTRNNIVVDHELGDRIELPEVEDINTRYSTEFTKLLNSNPNISRLDENMWMQVVSAGALRGTPFKEGDLLWVEFHLLNPRLKDDGNGHYFKVYSYREAEDSYFMSMLRNYWDQLNADLLIYSDQSLLPQEIQERDLFGSNIPRAYHVIFRKVLSKDKNKSKK